MKISEQGLNLIKQFEGFSATPYLCPAGKLTIGYGHVIHDFERFAQMSERDAEIYLHHDLEPVMEAIRKLVKVPLTQNQHDALCSLIFNIGIAAFSGSTLLRKLNRQTPNPSKEFLRWIYSGKTPLPGLVRRRQLESELFDKQ